MSLNGDENSVGIVSRRSARRGSVVPTGTTNRRRGRKETQFDWKLLAVVTFGAAMLLVAWAARRSEGTLAGFVTIPVLMGVSFPLIWKLARGEKRFDLVGLLMFSLAARFVLSVPRFIGAVDASVYHNEGVRLASLFRGLQFSVETGRQVPGTGSVRYVSGLVHVLTFDDFYSALLVFTLLAFWGTWFFYRAFTLAVPDGRHYRYAKLIFIWPSMLYWTSSLGKEALITFGVGLAALGLAMVIVGRPWGFAWVITGVVGTMMVRPHVAMVVAVAIFAALLVPKAQHGTAIKVGARVAALILLLIAGALLARITAEFLNIEDLGNDSLEIAAIQTSEMTGQGGSYFRPARVETPLHYPWAVVTVLIRPLPFEASTAEAFVTSLEGVVLAGLLVGSAMTLVSVPRAVRRYSYVGFAVAFILVFCFVFSVVGNFGILARQRTQVLPMVFVVLSLPKPELKPRGRRRGARTPVRSAGHGNG